MKGLFIKDFCLLRNQKQFFGILLVMVIMFSMLYANPSFILSYMVIMFSVVTITTISYDEAENGMAYIMTLPVSRKEYVREKYILTLVMVVSGFLIASAFTAASVFLRRNIEFSFEEWCAVGISCTLIAACSLSILLPVEFKFGAEKSRMAYMAVFVCGFGGAVLIAKLCKLAGIDINEVLNSIFEEHLTTVIAGILIFAAVIVIISYRISVHVMTKREF